MVGAVGFRDDAEVVAATEFHHPGIGGCSCCDDRALDEMRGNAGEAGDNRIGRFGPEAVVAEDDVIAVAGCQRTLTFGLMVPPKSE